MNPPEAIGERGTGSPASRSAARNPANRSRESGESGGPPMTDLGGLGYGVSLGLGINATGEAVGRSYLAQTVPTTGCPPRHTCVTHPADPFSWIAGSMTDLGTLGGTFSEARVAVTA